MGFVRCKKSQERKIDQRICMVCYDNKCEEKKNLGEVRIAKNEKVIRLLKLSGGKNGKGFNRS